MSDVQIPADAERLLVEWMLDTEAITDIFADRIYTAVPGDGAAVFPLVRVTRIGGAPTTRLARLDNPLMQVDVWGGPKSTARLGMATILAHAARELPGVHDEGVVGACEVGAMRWLPDDSYTPARPRYSADLQLWLHP